MLKPGEPTCDLEPEPQPAQLGRLELHVVDEDAGLIEFSRFDAAGRRVSSMLIDGAELVQLMIRLGFGGDLVPVGSIESRD